MALSTKKEIIDEIRYQTYGGMPSNDAAISEMFVLTMLNDSIAKAAVRSAFSTYNLDGVVAADDIFRLTYSNIQLLTDSISGTKYFQLPAQPVGLPRSRSYEIYPPANRGGVQSSIFKMIGREEATYVRSLPGIRKVFCYVDNGNMNLIDAFGITATYSTVNLSIVSAGASDINAFLNLPDDMVADIQNEIVADLRQMLGLQDTTPLPPADSPQPR